MSEPVTVRSLICTGCDKAFAPGDYIFVVLLDGERAAACRACARKEETSQVMIFNPPGASAIQRDRAMRRAKKLHRLGKNSRK